METIGTSLKTIFAKFQQVKKDTGEVNKDFSATINTLEKFGVKTGAMAGQLKPVGEILQEL
ncbi:lytic transglycosylase, partial [Clostridium botulinum C/D]|nr:lytic transglycosylase [Clostridium botulinum C/D]